MLKSVKKFFDNENEEPLPDNIQTILTQNFNGMLPSLCEAVQKNSFEVCEFLIIQLKVDVNIAEFKDPPLCIACRNNNFLIAQFLLQNGADPNIPGALNYNFFSYTYYSSALNIAMQNKNLFLVNLLIEYNASIHLGDSNNLCPIHFASKEGWDDLIRLFIRKGVNVNKKFQIAIDSEYVDLDFISVTPLHFAARSRRVSTMQILIQHGAEIDAVNMLGETSFERSVKDNDYEVAFFLLTNGADILKANGKVMFESALNHNNENIIYLLINNGVDCDIKLTNERTLLDCCVDKEELDSSVAKFIVEKLVEKKSSNCKLKYEPYYLKLREQNHVINSIWKETEEELIKIAERGDLEALNRVLNQKKDIDLSEEQNKALCIAAENGHVFVVSRLLDEKSVREKIEVTENEAFRNSCKNGHFNVSWRLLREESVRELAHLRENEALHHSAKNGDLVVVKQLLKIKDVIKAEIEFIDKYSLPRSALGQAAMNEQIKVVDLLLNFDDFIEIYKSKYPEFGCFHELVLFAASNGKIRLLEWLLRQKPEEPIINVAVEGAIKSNSLISLNWLLKNEVVRQHIKHVTYLLCVAAKGSNLAIVDYLLKDKMFNVKLTYCTANAAFLNLSPIEVAIKYNRIPIVQRIFREDVYRQKTGEKILKLAGQKGDKQLIESLIEIEKKAAEKSSSSISDIDQDLCRLSLNDTDEEIFHHSPMIFRTTTRASQESGLKTGFYFQTDLLLDPFKFITMKDPVFVPESLVTYERAVIESHFKQSSKDPLTKIECTKQLIPNLLVKQIIDKLNDIATKQREASSFPPSSSSSSSSSSSYISLPKKIFILSDIFLEYLSDPISYEVMIDPVIVPESGHTYEREWLLKHFERSEKDPMTNKVCSKTLFPNRIIKALIDTWFNHYPLNADEMNKPRNPIF